MAPLLLPPRVSGFEAEEVAPPDPEALIEEARARQRRRRLAIAAVVAALAAAAATGYGIDRAATGGRAAPGPAREPAAAGFPFAGHGLLAYVSRGRLLVLDGATGRTVTVASAAAHPGAPSFSPGGRWLSYSLGRAGLGVARSDGTAPHTLRTGEGSARWLPDGRLLVGRRIYRISASGAAVRAGLAPAGLVAWSTDGSRYAFVTRRLVHGANGSFHGAERLELAPSLDGPRTLWRSAPISFTRSGGFVGGAIDGVAVLPRGGVLFRIDPMQSASLAADGLPLYELRSPGAPARKLGVTVGGSVSVASGGKVAIGAGPDRYAWRTKTVRTCSAATARCSVAPAPAGTLTLDPAWSPDGATLAFVVAAPETAGDFRQQTVARWYATHHLWLLAAGAHAPTEVPGTRGAAAPAWSADGTSILFVRDDALWLIPRIGARPVKVSRPLFGAAWPSYYGQIGWNAQFAWFSG